MVMESIVQQHATSDYNSIKADHAELKWEMIARVVISYARAQFIAPD